MKAAISFFCAALFSSPAFCELTLIHDSGDTKPLAPILREAGFIDDGTWSKDPEPPMPDPRLAFEQTLSQIKSPSLSPGTQSRLPTGQAGSHLPRPMFLVGTDRMSLDWLSSNRERLVEIGAVGLVVDTSGGRQALSQIKAAAGALPLALGSGETLAEQFGIRHYPVLIGPQWIEQ